ncbi:MAG: PEP-CTERM sorting domain-containing protein [Phycisphaerae bacterium]|jgi:hypothetical protein
MKKLITIGAVLLIVIAANVNTFASVIQEDVLLPLGTYDVTYISFDYTYGGNSADDEFQIKGYYEGSGHWTMDINFDKDGAPLVIDTDYGPYYTIGSIGSYIGSHHYDFMLNSYTGLWKLEIDMSEIDFYATADTENPQPDGTEVILGNVVANKYYSDESITSGENALALGWATWNGSSLEGNAADGVGGVRQFKLRFYVEDSEGGDGDSHGDITALNVPEPATICLLGLGALSLIRSPKDSTRKK